MSHRSAHKGKARENTNWTEWIQYDGYAERTRWRDGKKAVETRYPPPPSTPRTDLDPTWSSNDPAPPNLPESNYQYGTTSSYQDRYPQAQQSDITRTQSEPTGYQQQPTFKEVDSTLAKYKTAPDYTQPSVPVHSFSTDSNYFPASSGYSLSSTGQASGLAPYANYANYANYATPYAGSSQQWPQTASPYNGVPAANVYGGYPVGGPQTEDAYDVGEASQTMENMTLDNRTNQGESGRGSRQRLEQALYKDFKVHHSKEFQVYRVFKTLWTEPAGVSNRANCTQYFKVKHGEDAYCGIRRMVIVQTKHGRSICLPILTYTHRGLNKDGVKASDHTIIYSSSTQPPQPENEPEIHEKAIRVKMDRKTETLHELSRLDYGTVHTVQHNFKVCFVGEIEKRDRATLMSTWKRVMDDNAGGDGPAELEG